MTQARRHLATRQRQELPDASAGQAEPQQKGSGRYSGDYFNRSRGAG
jgi:hypothetical protein